jgi:hypothetical protein
VIQVAVVKGEHLTAAGQSQVVVSDVEIEFKPGIVVAPNQVDDFNGRTIAT